jgi:hypothetical protein
MKPARSTTEHQLASRLQAHEFSFDPDAWAALEQQLPLTPPPAAPPTVPGAQSDVVTAIPGAAWVPKAASWVSGWLIVGALSLLQGGKIAAPVYPATAPNVETPVVPAIAPGPLDGHAIQGAGESSFSPQNAPFTSKNTTKERFNAVQPNATNRRRRSNLPLPHPTSAFLPAETPVLQTASPVAEVPATTPGNTTTARLSGTPLDLLATPRARSVQSLTAARQPTAHRAAQPPKWLLGPRWHYGLAGGTQWTNLRHDGFQLHLSPHVYAGIFAEYAWQPRLRLQGELNVKWARGYNFSANFTGNVYTPLGNVDTWNRTVSASEMVFVQLPLTAHFQSTRLPRLAWVGGLRPAWVQPLNSSENNWCTCGANPPGEDLSIRDGLRRLDLGVVAGVEWQLNPRWRLDLRLNAGLLDLTHDNFFNSTTTVTNTDLALGVRRYLH